MKKVYATSDSEDEDDNEDDTLLDISRKGLESSSHKVAFIQ